MAGLQLLALHPYKFDILRGPTQFKLAKPEADPKAQFKEGQVVLRSTWAPVLFDEGRLFKRPSNTWDGMVYVNGPFGSEVWYEATKVARVEPIQHPQLMAYLRAPDSRAPGVKIVPGRYTILAFHGTVNDVREMKSIALEKFDPPICRGRPSIVEVRVGT